MVPGKVGEATHGVAIFADDGPFHATEIGFSRVSLAKSLEVKDNSTGARKLDSRRTGWWSWEDSNQQPSDYEAVL